MSKNTRTRQVRSESEAEKALAFFHVAEGKTCYHDSSRERRERMTVLNTAAEKDKLSAWVQTYSGCNPCHMANVREASPKALITVLSGK